VEQDELGLELAREDRATADRTLGARRQIGGHE
jgi:hypothetical protein